MIIGSISSLAVFAAVLWPVGMCCAQFDQFKSVPKDPATEERHATCTLIADVSTLTPGSSATLGLAFTIQPKWHIYWNGRNDSGTAPKAEWTLPEGIAVETMLWPGPKRHVLPGDILDHIYENQVILLVPIRIADSVKPGQSLTIKAKVDWLVCDEMCVPEDAEVSITIPVGQPGKPATPSKDEQRIKQSRSEIPVPLSKTAPEATIKITPDGEGFKASISASAKNVQAVAFYPMRDSVQIDDPIASCSAKGSALTLKLTAPTADEHALRGVLAVTESSGDPPKKGLIRHFLVDVPLLANPARPERVPNQKEQP